MKRKSHFKRYIYYLSIVMFVLFIFSGCNEAVPARGIAPSHRELYEGMTIVYPQESEQFYVGDLVDIHAMISDVGGLSAAVLTVNEQVYRRDQFLDTVNNGDLYQPWIPTEAGVFALQIHGESLNGGQTSSNIVNVYVGMDEEEDAMPLEEVEEEVKEVTPEESDVECPIPMATSTSYPFCRSGPGTAYNTVTSLQPGQSFPVVAISGSRSWWKIEYSTSGATCWVWDDLVDICGDTDDIEVVTGTEKDAEAPAEAPEEESKPEPKPEPEQEPTWDPSSGPTSP